MTGLMLVVKLLLLLKLSWLSSDMRLMIELLWLFISFLVLRNFGCFGRGLRLLLDDDIGDLMLPLLWLLLLLLRGVFFISFLFFGVLSDALSKLSTLPSTFS